MPKPAKSFNIEGLGSALTAKYSLNPETHLKASRKAFALSSIAFSSYMWKGVGYFSIIFSISAFVKGTFFFFTLFLLIFMMQYVIILIFKRQV